MKLFTVIILVRQWMTYVSFAVDMRGE